MKQRTTIDGRVWKAMFTAGVNWLEKIVPDINALNVYPVPDGDCGTNMVLTLKSSLDQMNRSNGNLNSVSAVANAIAKGALMGARGNSGVILSQIFRGLQQGLEGKDRIGAADLAAAFREGSITAYAALSHPVDGTILTVMRSVADAAEKAAAEPGASPVSVMDSVLVAAREAVIDTPNLLDVLREAGVVDAGGHGLFTFLEGALLELKGETDGRSPEVLASLLPVTGAPNTVAEEEMYGFCTQFMLNGNDLSVAAVRRMLEDMGKSLIVVGDASVIRVHIHTLEPDVVIRKMSAYASVVDVDVNNMDDQHRDFLLMKRDRNTPLPAAVIAVVQGDGLIKVFSDLGVAAVITGGQTMNPSTMDFLETIEQVPSDNIILLPNNKNVVPTARLVQTLSEKNIVVIPTETVPQGISALVAFVPESEFDENVAEMMDAFSSVRTIEITRATRATTVSDIDIKAGQLIGLLDGDLLAAADTAADVMKSLLGRLDVSAAGIVTLYYGKDTPADEAHALADAISAAHPGVEVGVVEGGQPNYFYMISVE